ncbi:phosphotransferase [Paenibacillus sp. GD4]|uniref:phosphotransferase enzyme family protein n=1 Tax=Paenibacillus sp. GD4 TaxID=3068890 RepID=UPI002796CB7F|nr:phosphotransferase [Paenibacillus sp. GD4]MDQ1914675.1 phosphotransferase [Paenibacillus sp. GD4]
MDKQAAEIRGHLNQLFGLTVIDMVPIDKGWLNVKWRTDTDRGPLFVKYYHPDRYKLHSRPERKNSIEQTLRIQNGLNTAGIPCPKVHSYKGQHILETPSGSYYTVLDWVDGHTAQAGCLTRSQMYELGLATGRMHQWLRSVPMPDQPAWKPDQNAYWQEWKVNQAKAQEAGDEVVLEWLRRSQEIVRSMDIQMFAAAPTGWLHWDLWVDNIVLHDQGVAGIVDFDRMTVAYPEIDVARAILSGSLKDGQLVQETASAFMEGYRVYSVTPDGLLYRAMSMLYLIESLWWLRTEVRAKSELRGLLGRFVEEMHWIENHWTSLPDRLACL